MAKKSKDKILSEAEMRRKFPGSGSASKIYLDEDSTLWLPFRILALNYQLGGGIPYGKIFDGHGEESAGKTLLAYELASVCQSLGGKVIWVDAESSFDPAWAKKNGVNPDEVEILRDENVIERISDYIKYQILYWRSKLTKNQPILLVIDSFAAVDTQDNFEIDSIDRKAEMGKRASKIYEMLRLRAPYVSKYGVILYAINQLRKKVGATKFEDPDTVPGGEAMKFYASIRMGMYKGKRLKDEDDNPYGGVTYMRVKKNKVAPRRKNGKAEIYEEERMGQIGYNKYLGFLPILIDKGIVERKAGKIYYKGSLLCSYKDENETPFIKLIMAKDILRKNLIRKSGINTPSKLREKLNALDKNLYPVKAKGSEE